MIQPCKTRLQRLFCKDSERSELLTTTILQNNFTGDVTKTNHKETLKNHQNTMQSL